MRPRISWVSQQSPHLFYNSNCLDFAPIPPTFRIQFFSYQFLWNCLLRLKWIWSLINKQLWFICFMSLSKTWKNKNCIFYVFVYSLNNVSLTIESDVDDKNCNMQKSWNSFYIDISRGRIVARSGLFLYSLISSPPPLASHSLYVQAPNRWAISFQILLIVRWRQHFPSTNLCDKIGPWTNNCKQP